MTSPTQLIVSCHPSSGSLCARAVQVIEEASKASGRRVVVDDLVRIGFNPVISAEELGAYRRAEIPDDLQGLVDNLRQAQDLAFVLPVWMYDMPAILKGYFDRVWRSGVAFRIEQDELHPLLAGIRRLTVVVTHGRSRSETDRVGDGTRVFFATSLPVLLPGLKSNTRFDLYALDAPDGVLIDQQLDSIRQHFRFE